MKKFEPEWGSDAMQDRLKSENIGKMIFWTRVEGS
jgi:hypothetical protein